MKPEVGGVALSERVARLPQWRGIPVPFFVTYKTDGVPDFKVVDERNRARCATEKLCWICGEELLYRFVFIGGPRAAEARLYVDGPMHEECAQDAMKLCPFLVGRIDYRDVSLEKHAPTTVVRHFRPTSQVPPEQVVLYKTQSFTVKQVRDGWLFHAGPAVAIERVARKE